MVQSAEKYWDQRYRNLGGSGSGSRGRLAAFKAHTVNLLATKHGAKTCVDLGCGDGFLRQFYLFDKYVGVDTSFEAVKMCSGIYSQDDYVHLTLDTQEYVSRLRMDMVLSMDVTFHILNDDPYRRYLDLLCAVGRIVVLYAPNRTHQYMLNELGSIAPHCYFRPTALDLHDRGLQLIESIRCPWPAERYGPEHGSHSNFYIFGR